MSFSLANISILTLILVHAQKSLDVSNHNGKKTNGKTFSPWRKCESWRPLFAFLCLLFFSAKSRDASHNKLDSEVLPKVARMTVSGKKQTMGFDVPR